MVKYGHGRDAVVTCGEKKEDTFPEHGTQCPNTEEKENKNKRKR